MTEELEKEAQEYAKRLNYSMEAKHNMCERDFEIAFKRGADFVNKHWQEKTRWKSLETEPPKFEGKKYQILIRHSPITHDVACIVSPRSVEFCIAKGYKYWKEIE